MKDIFAEMDSRLNAINSTLDCDFKSGAELLDAIKNLSKSDSKELEDQLEEVNDAIKTIKIARKQDFYDVKSEETQLFEWSAKMFDSQYAVSHNKPSYIMSFEELSTTNLYQLATDHDSYWMIDFIKGAIITIREYYTGYKYVSGRLERFVPSKTAIKKYIKQIFELDPNNTFDDQVIRLFDDILDWEKEAESIGAPIEDTEIGLKSDILGMDLNQLKIMLELSDDDIINYHILHFTIKDCALKIIRLVRLLVANDETPNQIGLKKEDNWIEILSSYLGIDNRAEETGEDLFGESEWDDEMQSLSEKYEDNIFTELENNRKQKVEEDRKQKITDTLKQKAVAAKSIIIEDKNGNRYEFESKGECMKFLNVSTATFSQFIKGKSKLNKRYDIVSIG